MCGCPRRPTGRVPFAGLTPPRCPGRLSEAHRCPGEPCLKLWKLAGTQGGRGGSGPGLPRLLPASPELVPGSAPREAPAISPCVCQAPKTPLPICLPVHPPRSRLRVPDLVSLLFAHGSVSFLARAGSQGSISPVRLVEIDPANPGHQQPQEAPRPKSLFQVLKELGRAFSFRHQCLALLWREASEAQS